MRTDGWHAEYMQIYMQIDALILHGMPRHLWNNKLWPDKGLLPCALQLGRWEELSAEAQQAGRQAVSTAEQAVSCDYLLRFGAELSGSRWG